MAVSKLRISRQMLVYRSEAAGARRTLAKLWPAARRRKSRRFVPVDEQTKSEHKRRGCHIRDLLVSEQRAPAQPAGGAPSRDVLRRWLSLLDQPDRLTDADVQRLLQSHGRLPASASSLAIGRAAADLLTEKIEQLKPPAGAARELALPYMVLHTCFVDGSKLVQAAARLGMSARQLTRERARALELLAAELSRTAPPPMERPAYSAEPIPAILGFVPRPELTHTLSEQLDAERVVHVHGPRGIGKTSLVAEFATETQRRMPVLWYRFRAGVNDSLPALLFEIGEFLAAAGRSAVADYIASALPHLDTTLTARLVVRELGSDEQLWVIDDYHLGEHDASVKGFLEEAAARANGLRVLTVGRHSDPSAGLTFQVPQLTVDESGALLRHLGVDIGADLMDKIHEWTEGIPQLLRFAATWLRHTNVSAVSDWPAASLSETDEVQEYLLDAITSEALDSEDRVVLNAASVFRDRFSDDALAYVAVRTRGAVQDTSRRLVRQHLATRSRTGDVAFFHGTVRDYVYARLDAHDRRDLHTRAASWFRRHGTAAEVTYHQRRAAEAERQAMRDPYPSE